jgi:hypothetical protein
VGQVLSMGLAGLVLALFAQREAAGADRSAGFLAATRAAFLLYALLCVGGVFASLARGPGVPPPGERARRG